MKSKLIQSGWLVVICALLSFLFFSCKKDSKPSPPPPVVSGPFNFVKATVNDSLIKSAVTYNFSINAVIKIYFSSPVNTSGVAANVSFTNGNSPVTVNYTYSNKDSILIIKPAGTLSGLTRYTLNILTSLRSAADSSLTTQETFTFITQIDSTDKFPQISDSALLTLVQQQTFKYFWDFGDPVSGMARERNSDQTIATTGGTGFGIMATIVAINRNFITHADGLDRIIKIVNFYRTKATPYHGAFSHWINGSTGVTIPFGTQDNGGDIVETSYLVEGLLCARQYFNSTTDSNEINLRNNINILWNGVNWNWYRQNNQNVLYWNWSPDYNWAINAQVGGWSEALITYVLAASSPDSSVPKIVYDNGWARNGGIKNGNSYYGYTLPLGPSNGGPLFFEHYSFMGISPKGLSDAYADYDTQTINHTKINYQYCVADPHNYYGYSDQCWGLTASDVPTGYNANEPNNDVGVISPTAAISSFPYTPAESMKALKFFYYKLGNKLWGQYGFYDAFSLKDLWFANSTLAIDQGPQVVMIENYRSGLLWNLFMSCPEIKTGMKQLGFQSPDL
ncbi:MAG: glucoamylase family protein [Ginsengibacter sp.]